MKIVWLVSLSLSLGTIAFSGTLADKIHLYNGHKSVVCNSQGVFIYAVAKPRQDFEDLDPSSYIPPRKETSTRQVSRRQIKFQALKQLLLDKNTYSLENADKNIIGLNQLLMEINKDARPIDATKVLAEIDKNGAVILYISEYFRESAIKDTKLQNCVVISFK